MTLRYLLRATLCGISLGAGVAALIVLAACFSTQTMVHTGDGFHPVGRSVWSFSRYDSWGATRCVWGAWIIEADAAAEKRVDEAGVAASDLMRLTERAGIANQHLDPGWGRIRTLRLTREAFQSIDQEGHISTLTVGDSGRAIVEEGRGWPFIALWCEIGVKSATASLWTYTNVQYGEVKDGICLERSIGPNGEAAFRMIPLRVDFRGAALNVLVWAGPAMVVMIVWRLQRADSRMRRGACTTCGYNLTNATGLCPECGRGIQR